MNDSERTPEREWLDKQNYSKEDDEAVSVAALLAREWQEPEVEEGI